MMSAFTIMPRIYDVLNQCLSISHHSNMPMCVVCLNRSDSTSKGGTCRTCSTPPKPDYFQYRVQNLPPQQKRVKCVSCGKDTGFNEKTVMNACWGNSYNGQQCFKCHERYNSGVSSFSMCCVGRE
jgi:hypothetical protein